MLEQSLPLEIMQVIFQHIILQLLQMVQTKLKKQQMILLVLQMENHLTLVYVDSTKGWVNVQNA